jgi:regulator of protease activity HflC (stomatin/prohibitin superfamily)
MKWSNLFAADFRRDPYHGVVTLLLALSLVGAAAAVAGGFRLANPVVLDTAVALGISAGVLGGVALTRMARARPRKSGLSIPPVRNPETVRIGTATAGGLAIGLIQLMSLPDIRPDPLEAGIGAALCLVAAGLAATAVRYLAEIDPARLPEGPGLCRGARVMTWLLVLAAVSIGCEWARFATTVRVLNLLVVTVILAVCHGLFMARVPATEVVEAFPLDLGALSFFGGRTNILASVLDGVQHQLGIDLRSTWALIVVRRSLEPLIVGLCVVGWLSTSLTVVGVAEQGLVERFGVPVNGAPLQPGLHAHWPLPIDHVLRIPVQRVQLMSVGHEGQEEAGPEDVLWARQHAANEYTLLLGNGRDLITIDAGVQFRITDPRAWTYNWQNPADVLKAIAYRAVMRSTVNHTLAEALSENLVTTTAQMRAMVQHDADVLRLGIQVLAFTVGGMHPPVMVAADYEKVVSAELGKVTAVVNAQAERNRIVPLAESTALVNANAARADGARDRALSAGEAWSFRTLEMQYRLSPQDYLFRRRLETLERGLMGRAFTVVDHRFERDGGVLWLNP